MAMISPNINENILCCLLIVETIIVSCLPRGEDLLKYIGIYNEDKVKIWCLDEMLIVVLLFVNPFSRLP